MSSVLLDTSGYRALKRNHPGIIKALEEADSIALNAIVIGEILAGFDPGRKSDENKRILWEFVASPGVEVISLDESTAERYAIIHDFLRRKGTQVSPNDLWIAASAMEHGLHVLTLDTDFHKIPQVLSRVFQPS